VRAADNVCGIEGGSTMYRRTVVGAAGAAVLALACLAGTRAQDKGPKDHMHGAYAKCAKACADCMLECDSCFKHCSNLVTKGEKDHTATMYLCNDCGEICAGAARIVGRGGPLAVTTCESCAKACDTCGEACGKFPDDAHMKRCAQACRDCAKACREMIDHAGTSSGKKAS
jgi:hypothetical protein